MSAPIEQIRNAAEEMRIYVQGNINILREYARVVYDHEDLQLDQISLALDAPSGLTATGYAEDGPFYYVIPFEYLEDPKAWMAQWMTNNSFKRPRPLI